MGTSRIEISRNAVHNNVKFLKSYFGEKVRLSPVIKGNAYGHGIEIMVPLFEEAGIDFFSVFSSGEARRASSVISEGSRIMIMGYTNPDDLDWVMDNDIEFYVSSLHFFRIVYQKACSSNKQAKIHLDLETGMYRTGLTKPELDEIIRIMGTNCQFVYIKGITTHLAGAESIANYLRINKQIKLFHKRLRYIEKKGITYDIKHTASSAASMSYPKSRMDLVRAGIISYGYWPTRETFMQYLNGKPDKADPLMRAISWKSFIMTLKNVPQGEFVGYGYNYQAQSNMQIALVPVGYSNGYSRQLSNNGHVLVRDQRADVIGAVNMNMIVINTSEIDPIEIDDEVILIGTANGHDISVASFAEMNNSMNYELLSRLPESIERKIIE
jgi:alanine racemase